VPDLLLLSNSILPKSLFMCFSCVLLLSCRHLRKRMGKDMDPPTPDIKKRMAKREWDGMVRRSQQWKKPCQT
jgi:hypothetical protein